MLYFIQSGNRIKIGRASNPHTRFRTIHTASPEPCRLLLTIHLWNESEAEKILHQHFREYRTNGEWFEINLISAFRALIDLKLIPEHDSPMLGIPVSDVPPMHSEFEKWFAANRNTMWSQEMIEDEDQSIERQWLRHHNTFLSRLKKYRDVDEMIHMERPISEEEGVAFFASLKQMLAE